MNVEQVFYRFLISLAIGTLMGIEREKAKKNGWGGFAGIRTFMLISLSGTAVAFLAEQYSSWVMVVSVGCLMFFVSLMYFVTSYKKNLLVQQQNLL